MLTPYYEDNLVTLYHGDCEAVLPELDAVSVVITDPPYSAHVHGNARSSRMQSANDHGGKYGADVRRNVNLGFEHLSPDLRAFCAEQFARIAERTTLLAAAYLGRKAIGVERDEKHAETIATRLQNADTTIFGGVA